MPKGPRKHLKRLAAPWYWPIRRKEHPFTIRTNPGPHPLKESMPLGLVIQDLLLLTKTNTETRGVIARGAVKVDGKICKDYKRPIGLMDIVEVPEVSVRVRALPARRHLLRLQPISQKEADVKLCKIEGKSSVAKGNIELHLHDGRTILLPVKDPKAAPKEKYRCGDSLLITVPDQAIRNHVPLKEGITAIITGGIDMSFMGKLTKIDAETGLCAIEGAEGKTILTALDYVFPLGEEKPLVSMKEAG
jgi:small subunit ribosomal protein S4e